MGLDDAFGWGAIALVVGPILAGLAIPVFKWMMDDLTRLLIPILLLGGAYWWYYG